MKRCILHITNKLKPLPEEGIARSSFGTVELLLLRHPATYHCLVDEILIVYGLMRDVLLKAYKEERLYTLHSNECDENSLPCLASVSKRRRDTIEFIWTRNTACRKGLGSALLKLLKIKYAVGAVPAPFWSKRGITLIPGFKPKIHNILVRDNSTSTLSTPYKHLFDDSLYDSSEEEPQDRETLNHNVLKKLWLVNEITGVQDIALTLARLIYSFHTSIEFHCIDPEYHNALYGIMSETRLKKQAVKGMTPDGFAFADDNTRMYAQFIKGVNHLVRNRTMSISRLYEQYIQSDSDSEYEMDCQEDIAELERATEQAIDIGLSTYISPFENTAGSGRFLLVMDSGINRLAAIEFAKVAVLDANLCEDV
jgi:hypothetical protein